MPELPEVQTVVNTLTPHVVGAVVAEVDVVRAEYVEPADVSIRACLLGRRVTGVHRRGKRILVSLDDGNRLLIHLGMTGRVTIEPPGRSRLPHTHVVLVFHKQAELGRLFEVHIRDPRRFGRLVWLGGSSGEEGLGPEPLSLTPGRLAKTLQRCRKAVKAVLLDQQLIAGLGNIYADEALFLAGLHPLSPASEIDETACRRLCRSIKQVLRKALKHRGSTLRDYVDADGGAGSFQKLHNVYGRDGQECRKCGAMIGKLTVAGRTTCFCPDCQPSKQTKRLREN